VKGTKEEISARGGKGTMAYRCRTKTGNGLGNLSKGFLVSVIGQGTYVFTFEHDCCIISVPRL